MVKRAEDEAVFVISVAARLAKVHPRTLRIYESCGLLNPARTEGNIRLYSQNDVNTVKRIRFLTQVKGVNLAGVKIIIESEQRLGVILVDEGSEE